MQTKTNPFSETTIALQSWLRPALTPVGANCDYERFRADLEPIEKSIRDSQVEKLAVEFALEALPSAARAQDRQKRAQFAVVALRMELLRHLLGLPSFRAFSRHLASSDLLADFCHIRDLSGINWSSKSTLHRASELFSAKQLRRMNEVLTEVAANEDLCTHVGLEEVVDASVLLADSTCLEANIHYPVDWVLLKDVSHTLLQAIALIRSEGLLNRMEKSPEDLAREMNRLCIEMTHSRRRKDAKKRRKAVFRKMKALLKCIGGHARKHRDRLESAYVMTRWSARQAARIIVRIKEKLERLPKVIKQAHERIIGGRLVANEEKILSVHEGNIRTLVRGKSGKEVVPRSLRRHAKPFGNALYIAESLEGFILDYELYPDKPPSEEAKLRESLVRQQSLDIDTPIEAVVCDRGFDTRRMRSELKEAGIANMICPRHVKELKKRMQDDRFRALQRRRGATEGRIAILKNNGGRVCRAKGYESRARAVGFGVLAHNMWWIARTVREADAREQKEAA